MNRTLSRREKKKATDGVTLTGISQTGDQALQNKPSRWVLGGLHPWERSLGQVPEPSARAGAPPPWTSGRVLSGASQGPPVSICPHAACWARAPGHLRKGHPSIWCQRVASHKCASGPKPGEELVSGAGHHVSPVVHTGRWKSLSVVSFRRAQVSWPGLHSLPGLCAGAGGGQESIVSSFSNHLFVESLAYS